MTEEFLHGIRFLPFIIKLCKKVYDYAPSFEPTIYRTLIRITRGHSSLDQPLKLPFLFYNVLCVCACVCVCVCVCVPPRAPSLCV